MSDKSSKGILRGVMRRSITDDAFRQKLVTHPKAVLEKASGRELADGVKVIAHDGTPVTLSVVLPRSPDVKLTLPAAGHVVVNELSDDELDRISGVASAATILQTMWSGRR